MPDFVLTMPENVPKKKKKTSRLSGYAAHLLAQQEAEKKHRRFVFCKNQHGKMVEAWKTDLETVIQSLKRCQDPNERERLLGEQQMLQELLTKCDTDNSEVPGTLREPE